MKQLDRMSVLIVGLGQIGGSIGLDLVRGRLVGRVIGFDRDKKQAQLARKMRGVEDLAADLKSGVEKADLVVLAVPVSTIIKLLPIVLKHISDHAAVFDVGSTKTEIIEAVRRSGRTVNYIGGHPLAGNERHGFAAAERGKFRDATFALVPAPGTKSHWVSRVRRLVRLLGARPLMINAEEHDRLMAVTSGLPYMIALGLMNLAVRTGKRDPEMWRLAAGSFRSATRVAVSSPDMTIDLLLSNRRYILEALKQLTDQLSAQEEMLARRNRGALRRLVHRAYIMARTLPPG